MLMNQVLQGPLRAHWAFEYWDHLPDDGKGYEIIAGMLCIYRVPSDVHRADDCSSAHGHMPPAEDIVLATA